jgi:peptidoglycan hydrolase-like protein with peptidoglycan-binding domain
VYAKIRQLQRDLTALGLNVGGIDGILGQGTIAALNVFNSATGSTASLKDIDGAINIVESFNQNCVSSGLRCLLSGQQKK